MAVRVQPSSFTSQLSDPLNDSVNAFCEIFTPPIQKTKVGSLSALTFAVKDIFAVEGHSTGAGHPDYKVSQPIATKTAPSITEVLDQGAMLVGTTHTDELASSLFGVNYHYGTPINSASPDRVPGGSSSGSASAVAAGLVDFALGGDTSGSVRAPASFCGLYGYRPTHGAISLEECTPISPAFDTVGTFARDLVTLSNVVQTLLKDTKHHPALPKLVVATNYFADLEGQLQQDAQVALEKVKQPFATIREHAFSDETIAGWCNTLKSILRYDLWQSHGQWVEENQPVFGTSIRNVFTEAQNTSR